MKQFKRMLTIGTTILFWGFLGLLLLLYINPAGLVLMLTGFQSEGATSDYFQEIETKRGTECYLPWPVSQTAGIRYPTEPINAIEVAHWSLPDGYAAFSTDELKIEQMERGQMMTGEMMLYAEYSEQGLNEVWQEKLSAFANPSPELAAQVKNARVDLKSDRAIIYADVNMGTKWQEVGIILTLDKQNLQFAVDGVEFAGEYYTPPTQGTVAELIIRLEENINEILRSTRLVDTHNLFLIQHIAIHEDRVQILAGWEHMPRLAPICPQDWSLLLTDSQNPHATRRINDVHLQHWALPNEQLIFDAEALGTRRLEKGMTELGQPVYYAKISETALNSLWQDQLRQYVNANPEMTRRVRDSWAELRAGTIIIYADLRIDTHWQQVGLILSLDEKTPQFKIAGIELDGKWHSRPEDGPIAEWVVRIEENINEVLRSTRIIDPYGAQLPLHSLTIEEDWLMLLARD